MRKTTWFAGCLMLIVLVAGASVGSSFVEERETGTLDVAPERFVNITQPNVGYLYAFGGRIYIGFLEELGWGVVLDDALNVTVNASEDIDYVVFNLTNIHNGFTYIQNDTEPPFEASFMVPNSFFYVINVTGYHNGTACCSDQEGYIAYINLRLSNWP